MTGRIALVLALTLPGLRAQDEIVPLTEWRMKAGDDARWASPEWDDSAWTGETPLSSASGAIGQRGHPAVTWYRATCPIPPLWRAHSLSLGIWKLDDAYEVYAGGLRLGSFGSLPPPGILDHGQVVAYPFRRMSFAIPLDACRNGEVRLAIRRWRLPVVNAWEFHEVAPLSGRPAPVIGLTAAVAPARALLAAQQL